MEIPENHQEICREFAKLAKKYDLRTLILKYGPSIRDTWNHNIEMSWESGRHEDSVNNLTIHSTLSITTHINEKETEVRQP